jgi:S1-C subfamily serine protease
MRPIPSHWPLAVTAGSLAALIAIGAVAGAGLQEPRSDRERRALLENELNTIDIIERYGDSVVAVTVALQGQVFSPFAESTAPDAPPEPFKDEPVQASSGSGFLIEYRKEPFLVTNYHVVESALEPASARLLDGAEVSVTFPADPEEDVAVEVVGVNPSYDLALLRLRDAARLPDAEPLTIADSDVLQVGQKTVAIGNPFGLASTVTSGIVSALSRFVPTIGQLPVPMIQTDAAINPGNSGGPLLDSRGELIGINTAIINPQGRSFAGLGFAVPSNLLAESLARLEVGGVTDVSSIRPRLGIAAQSVADYPAALRAQLALPEDGVVVLEVQPGSVADRAGLRGSRDTIVLDSGAEVPAPGDVIVAVDGEPVDEVEDITLRVTFGADAGDRVVLGVIRDGQRLRVPVTLEVSTANAFEAPSAD